MSTTLTAMMFSVVSAAGLSATLADADAHTLAALHTHTLAVHGVCISR